MIAFIRKLIEAGKTNAEVVAACNEQTIEVADDSLFSVSRLKAILGARRSGEAIEKLAAIADGSGPMPPSVPESIRSVVAMELQQLAGSGLDLSDAGTNGFLRMVGLVDVADIGRRMVSPWQDDGNKDDMTIDDLRAVKKQIIVNDAADQAIAKANAVQGWLDTLDTSEMSIDELKAYTQKLLVSVDGNG